MNERIIGWLAIVAAGWTIAPTALGLGLLLAAMTYLEGSVLFAPLALAQFASLALATTLGARGEDWLRGSRPRLWTLAMANAGIWVLYAVLWASFLGLVVEGPMALGSMSGPEALWSSGLAALGLGGLALGLAALRALATVVVPALRVRWGVGAWGAAAVLAFWVVPALTVASGGPTLVGLVALGLSGAVGFASRTPTTGSTAQRGRAGPPAVFRLGVLRLAGLGLVGAGLGLPWVVSEAGLLGVDAPPAEVSGALRPELVELPGGTFTMGSPEGEGYYDEYPQRRVEVAGFAMCRTEVTQAQWRAVMSTVEGAEANPSDCGVGCGDDHPVQAVSWFDAITYLNSLSDLEDRSRCYVRDGDAVEWQRGCTGYRLPTEAEWEYAARAGTETPWSWGDDEARAGLHAWFDGNADRELHPVGTKRPNPWGLSDVHGNVWEWVWDGYAGDAYRRVPSSDETVIWSDTIVNPNDTPLRVLRGGSFVRTPYWLRSAVRDWDRPGFRLGDYGFRCVRAPQLVDL